MNFNKQRLLFIAGYVTTSIWGLLMFVAIRTEPYNYNDASYSYLTGVIMVDIILTTGPLGVVFAVDRYYSKKEKQHAIQ